MFVQNFFGGAIPIIDLTDEDKNFIALINKELKTYIDDLEKMRWFGGYNGKKTTTKRMALNDNQYTK